MNKLFNESPLISYSPDMVEHQETISQGYASQIDNKNNSTVLFFQDVEDHVDGNGQAVLWLIQGEGKFFVQGEAIDMKVGDAILFNDFQEHGFESQELCIAVNFTVMPQQTVEEIKAMVRDFNHPVKKLKM